jgi:hypothetical protein
MDESWKSDLDRWLSPFLSAFQHKARARMCPVYVARDRPARSAGRKQMGRAATAVWLILRLMGRASSSNSGKRVPSAHPPLAGPRPFAPNGRHVCTSSARMMVIGDDSKELSPRRKRSLIASRPRLSGLVARRDWCRANSRGRRGVVCAGKGRAVRGARNTPGFPPMFRDRAGGAFSRMPIGARLTNSRRLAPADQFSGSARRVDERHRDEGNWIAAEFSR